MAVLIIATLSAGYVQPIQLRPPFAVGEAADVATVLSHNLLVLALHAMACVAGFIAGSSLPLQAESKSGLSRWVHEHGGRIAIAFVVCATTFSLSAQAYLLGHTLAGVAHFVKVSPALLLLGLLPHALPELIALFLPLAAWIIASRRGEWEQLLAATVVTVAIALPVLVVSAFVEVYVSPHLFTALTGLHPPIVGTGTGSPCACTADTHSRSCLGRDLSESRKYVASFCIVDEAARTRPSRPTAARRQSPDRRFPWQAPSPK